MVEFALVAPLFFLLLFGIIEAGRFIFYYETLAIPILGLLLLAIAAWRGTLPRPEGAVAAMAVLLSIIVIGTLVRGSPDSRLPDVTTVVAATGAWIAARICRAVAAGGRRVCVAIVVLFWVLVVWAAGTNALATKLQ